MRLLESAWRTLKKTLARWYIRMTRRPCPHCGARDHEHLRWQCAACGNTEEDRRIEKMFLPRCGNCGGKHLDSVRNCQNCETVFNPRFYAEAAHE